MRKRRSWPILAAIAVVSYIFVLTVLSYRDLPPPSSNSGAAASLSSSPSSSGRQQQQHRHGRRQAEALVQPFGGRRDGRLPPLPRRLGQRKVLLCANMTLRDPPGPAVALASFPGSGNTWLRYLVQQATGIYSGSIYKDTALLRNGFPAESVANGSVLLVKTHEWGTQVRANFSHAVLLVRDPSAAILAEFNRQAAGHVGHASPDKYSHKSGQFWRDFVRGKSRSWLETNLDWLQFDGPLHVLSYESLVADVGGELRALLLFLGVRTDHVTFECALRRKEGIYRRGGKLLHFDPFDAAMKTLLKRYVQLFATAFTLYSEGYKSQMVDFIEATRRTL